MDVEVKVHRSPSSATDPTGDSTYVTAKFATLDMILQDKMAVHIYRTVCEKIAARYVEENYAAIAAKLDQTAIANLAIAESAKKIAEEIKLRPVVLKEVQREVYQRGIFGGVTRLR